MAPEMVHYGKAEQVSSQRQVVLVTAFESHPERFVRGIPMPPSLPEVAWINKPKVESTSVVFVDDISIPEVSEYGLGENRRSWENIEIDSFSPALQQYGNDTKFESEVSHRR